MLDSRGRYADRVDQSTEPAVCRPQRSRHRWFQSSADHSGRRSGSSWRRSTPAARRAGGGSPGQRPRRPAHVLGRDPPTTTHGDRRLPPRPRAAADRRSGSRDDSVSHRSPAPRVRLTCRLEKAGLIHPSSQGFSQVAPLTPRARSTTSSSSWQIIGPSSSTQRPSSERRADRRPRPVPRRRARAAAAPGHSPALGGPRHRRGRWRARPPGRGHPATLPPDQNYKQAPWGMSIRIRALRLPTSTEPAPEPTGHWVRQILASATRSGPQQRPASRRGRLHRGSCGPSSIDLGRGQRRSQ